MAEMLDRYGEQGLTIVAVNLDQDPEAATAFLADVSGGFQHINDPDGKIPEAFGITVMPSSVLFDRDGKPVYRHEGFRSDQKAEYERKVVALLKGQVDPDQEAIALVSQAHLVVT